MAKISNKIAYPGANPIEGEDYLIGTDANSSPIELQTKTFLISDLKSFIIDDLFDGVAYRLPVFTAAAEGEDSERIVPSIVKQDVAQISGTSILGTTITIDNNAGGGSLVVTDAFTPFGLSTFEGNVILKKTNTLVSESELYLLGKIYDANSNLGNNEQVLVSDGLGNVTWQNFQGSGLEFQSAWDARKISEGGVTDGGNPDLQNIQLIPGNTGKYWVVSQAGSASLQGQAGLISQWSPGDWAIVSEDDTGNVFWDKIDNSSVDGAGTENHIAMWTSAKTLGNAAPVTMIQDPDPAALTLTFAGGERVIFDTAIELQGEVYDNGANAGTSNDILVSDSSSQLSYQNLSTIHVNSAEKLTQQVIFREAVTIGDPVYIVGYNNGQSLTEVEKADASDVNKMAAIGLAKQTKAANEIGDIVISGDFPDIDTSSYSVGDSLYVAVGGGLTNTKPVVPNLIQKIAIVSRSNANNGDIEVFAVGRTNDVPNLTEGRIFVGSAANTIESDTVFLNESLHSATIGANTNSATADNSIAMGSGTSATEIAATAMGTGTTASGASSVAMGDTSTAIGDYSFVVGLSSNATAQHAVAIGESNTASSPNSVAIGDNNTISTQQGGIAIGTQNTVNGGNAFALGSQVTASGNTSLATGYQTSVLGNYSISSGLSTETKGQQSIAGGIGSVVRSNSDNSIAFGNKAIAGLGITDYKESAAFGFETLAGGSFGSFAMGWRSFNVGSEGLASGHGSFVSGHGSGALGEGSSVTDVAAGVLNTSSGVNTTQFQLINVVGGANIQVGDTIYNNGSGSQDWTESNDFRINTIVSANQQATTPAGDVYFITVNAPGFKTNQGETVSIVRTVNATEGSFAIGAHSITLGNRSTSIGYFAKAESDQSVAIGEHAWTKNTGSVSIGKYAIDDAAEQVAIGGTTVRLNAYGTGTPITGTVVANLGVDSTGKVIETDPSVDGSGTVDFVPKWTPDGNTLGDSIIFEDPNNPFIGISTSNPSYPLDVVGDNAIAINNTAIAHQSNGAPTGAPNASGIIQLGDVDGGAMALGLMDDTSTEVVRIQTDSNNVGEVIFYDTVRAQFGDSITGSGAQGEIYSDGNNFRIAEIGGGNLYLSGSEVIINDTTTGLQYFHGTNGTTVKLYGNDPLAGSTIQLETASTGVTINNDLTLADYGQAGKGGTVAFNLAVDSTGRVIQTTDGGGTVTGTGTTNKLPIWTDGPNGVLGDSGLTQNNNGLTFTIGGVDSVLGNAGNFSLAGQISTGSSTQGVSSFSDIVSVATRLDAGTNATAGAPALDVKQKAYVRGGLVVSEFPGNVTVDNTAIVVGAGNNDIVTGSDHCIAVGNNNQINNNSDNSAVFGQGNTIDEADACLVAGLTNSITGTQGVTERSAVVGFNNSLQGYASAVYGGSSTVVVDNNAFVLGFDHDVNAANSDSIFVFGEQNDFADGGTNAANVFMIGADLVGNDGTMVLGYRNDNTQYPAENNANGLGETKFVVAVGSAPNNTNQVNALLITEGGVNKSNTPQIPRVIMPSVTNFEFDDDPDATANAIPQGGLYHKEGSLYINTGSSTITRGTWTPGLSSIGASNFNFTPTVQGGEFKRIEDMMFCYFTLAGTVTYNTSNGGFPLLNGLPASYQVRTNPFQELLSGTIKKASGLSALITGFTNGPGSQHVAFEVVSGNNTTIMATNNIGIQSGVAFSIRGSLTYIIQ